MKKKFVELAARATSSSGLEAACKIRRTVVLQSCIEAKSRIKTLQKECRGMQITLQPSYNKINNLNGLHFVSSAPDLPTDEWLLSCL